MLLGYWKGIMSILECTENMNWIEETNFLSFSISCHVNCFVVNGDCIANSEFFNSFYAVAIAIHEQRLLTCDNAIISYCMHHTPMHWNVCAKESAVGISNRYWSVWHPFFTVERHYFSMLHAIDIAPADAIEWRCVSDAGMSSPHSYSPVPVCCELNYGTGREIN